MSREPRRGIQPDFGYYVGRLNDRDLAVARLHSRNISAAIVRALPSDGPT
jgi:hypothetical protein